MKILSTITLLLLSLNVGASDVVLNWNVPTEQEDCTITGNPPDLAGYKLYELLDDINDPSATSYTKTNVFPGSYAYMITAYNSAGEESRPGLMLNIVSDTLTTIAPTVYAVQHFENKFLLLPVGTVALGLSCIKEESVNGHYAIARDVVTWAGSIQPEVVVAKCG